MFRRFLVGSIALVVVSLVACSHVIGSDEMLPLSPTLPDEAVGQTHPILRRTVVVLGSSTAEGMGASRADSGWVGRLAHQARQRCPEVKLHNLAKGGYTTFHVLSARWPGPGVRPQPDTGRNLDKALSFQPGLVILQINSNDPSNGYPSEETIRNHRRILDSLRASGVEALVVGPFPRFLASGEPRKMLTLRDSLPALVGKDAYAGVWDSVAQDDVHLRNVFSNGDGIHVNDVGHALIFRQIVRTNLWKRFCP